jgi:hypothetical protein
MSLFYALVRFVLCCIMLSSISTIYAKHPLRTWTSKEGKTIQARFVEEQNGKIIIKREDGRQFKVLLDKFSPVDQEYVHAQRFDPNLGLVAWYPFNGNAQDESGNGHHGKVNGATLCKDRKGKDDSAYNFDGVDDFIRIANSDFMNPSSISISCWYAGTKSFEGGGTNVLVQKPYLSHKPPFYQWQLAIGGDKYPNYKGKFLFATNAMNTGQSVFFMGKEKVINVWNHLISIVDARAQKCKICLNGQVMSQYFWPDYKMGSYQTDIFIAKHGNITGTKTYTPGEIDDVRLYDRALSKEEISSLYQLEK